MKKFELWEKANFVLKNFIFKKLGSFGLAILYRRRDDDSLVILKEINLHELSSNERQLALNEVYLLSRLHHPYIISYYDSFEKNGILMIEMEYANGGFIL